MEESPAQEMKTVTNSNENVTPLVVHQFAQQVVPQQIVQQRVAPQQIVQQQVAQRVVQQGAPQEEHVMLTGDSKQQMQFVNEVLKQDNAREGEEELVSSPTQGELNVRGNTEVVQREEGDTNSNTEVEQHEQSEASNTEGDEGKMNGEAAAV